MQTSKKAKTRRIYIGTSTKICSRSAHIWPKELAPRGALLLWQIIVAPLGPIKYTWIMKWKSQTHSAFGNFSNLEKFPGMTALFLKLAEDDILTGLQTITKKAFHMLISKRTTNYCGTICHSKISSLGDLFLFLVQMLKSFELTLFFQHTDWPLELPTNHRQALNILSVRDST
jgi:hypothetical protein